MENPIENGWFGGTTIFGNTYFLGGVVGKKTEKWVEFGFVDEFFLVFFFSHTILQKNMLVSKLDQAFFSQVSGKWF